jgi:hypothetical protein
MSARSGMASLITQFRRLTDDAGTAIFTDDRVQEIFDNNRFDFYQDPLTVTAQQIASGTVGYHVYTSAYNNLEGTASGTVAFRLYDSRGTVLTTGYTADVQRGVFTFSASQAGSARYLDARAFDLYGAVAEGWRERAGLQANDYDFRVEGRQYSRSQWFKHCFDMASFYNKQAKPKQAVIERGDMC